VDRAAAVLPGFSLTTHNAEAVASICRALDGLPLALELAAPLVRVAEPAAVAQRLRDRFDVLTGAAGLPGRHRSLLAALDWSHELLDDDERMLFRRLSVFVGGATLPDIEAVCTGEDLSPAAILPLLARLSEASLVVTGPAEDVPDRRMTLLETTHIYAARQLAAAGEEEELRNRHAAHLCRVAEQADRELHGVDQQGWADRLAAELSNIHAALDWALRSDPTVGARLTAALGWFWFRETLVSEAREWTERALQSDAASDGRLRARLQAALGVARYLLGDAGGAVAAVEDALEGSARAADGATQAYAHFWRGWLAVLAGETDLALQHLTHCEELAPASGQEWLVPSALTARATAALLGGDLDTALAQTSTALADAAALGDLWGEAYAAWVRTHATWAAGDVAGAYAGARAAGRASRIMRHHGGVISSMHVLAATTALQGDPERGAVICGAVHALIETWQLPPAATEVQGHASHHAALEPLLTAEALADARERGAALTMAEAVALAGLEV
jgi:tetratricopeptide (TPR) repeat protein